MDNTPSSSPPPSPAPSGGNGRLIGAVVLAGAVAAGAMMLLRPGATPEAPKAPEKAASAPTSAPAPVPAPPAVTLFSETIGDVEVTTAVGPLSFKGLKTVDSTLPKAAIEAILKGDASQITKLDAKTITADSMSWSQNIGGKISSTTYEGLSASAIKAGVISSFTAQRGTGKGETGDKGVLTETTFEEMALANFDLPLMLRWFNEADPEGKAELAPLHGAYRIKSIKVIADKVQVDFGAVAFTGSKLRPARRPVSTLMAELRAVSESTRAEAQSKADAPKLDAPKLDAPKKDAAPVNPFSGNKVEAGPQGNAAPANPFAGNKAEAAPPAPPATPAPPKAEVAKVNENLIFMSIIDLMSSFELGEGTIDGIKITGKDTKPEDAFSSEIRKASFAGGAKAHFGFEGLSVKAADGTFSLGKVDMGGDTLSLFILGIDKAIRARAGEPKPGDDELKALIKTKISSRALPDVTFGMEAMAGDFPAEKGKPEAGRVTFDMKRASFLIGNFVSLTPTKIDYVVDSINVPMPKDSKDASIMTLRAMGIERLGLSARVAAAWAEAGEKLSLQEVSVDVAQLARLAISGEMGAVPRAFFEDPQRNWPSAMGATINSFVMDVDNKGGLAKLVDVVAKEQKKSGEQLRNEFANIAPLLITGMLAGHPDGGKISQAVSNFIRNLNGLHMKVTAAGPNGIVLTDLAMAGQNPAEFAQKLRFEVEGK